MCINLYNILMQERSARHRKETAVRAVLSGLAVFAAGTIFESRSAPPVQAARQVSSPNHIVYLPLVSNRGLDPARYRVVSSNDTQTRLVFDSQTEDFFQDELPTPYTSQFTIYFNSPVSGDFQFQGRGCAISPVGYSHDGPETFAPADVLLMTPPVYPDSAPHGYHIKCLGGFDTPSSAIPNIPTDYTNGVTLDPIK